jgi:hypothetical protein
LLPQAICNIIEIAKGSKGWSLKQPKKAQDNKKLKNKLKTSKRGVTYHGASYQTKC